VPARYNFADAVTLTSGGGLDGLSRFRKNGTVLSIRRTTKALLAVALVVAAKP
jgi:hypothetical protein